MYNEVKIGSKTVPMLAVASVDVYYREIFHEDAVKIQANENQDAEVLIDFVQQMAFVMAKFAELKDRKEMLSHSFFEISFISSLLYSPVTIPMMLVMSSY